MGDAHASKPSKAKIPDEEDNMNFENLDVEKLGHNEAMDFQSSSGGITQESAGIETCIVSTHEAHGKKLKKNSNKPLPCPRCESFDTKFCYFNNYNINQPRHFCRKCQRYWTAGGLLRNVPRGAGRRSKYNTTHQKHDVLSDAKALGCNAYNIVPNRTSSKSDSETGFLPTQKALFPFDLGELVREDGLSASSTMISFGQQRPLRELMAAHSLSVQQLNMTKGSFNEWRPSHLHVNVVSERQILEHEGSDMHASSCLEAASIPTTSKHIHRLPEGLGMVSHYSQEKYENVSSSSRILNTESNGPVKQEEKGENLGLHTWPWRHFDAAKESATSTSASHCSSTPSCSSSSMKVIGAMSPSNCTSTHGHYDDSAKEKATSDYARTSEGTLSTTLNGLPSALWAQMPWIFMPLGPLALDWANNAYWHMPWFLAALASSSSAIRSPELQRAQAGSKDEGCLWVPKTLRIDDPVDAAQSSIWKTLGLDREPGSSALKGDIKNTFQCEAGTQDEAESSTPPYQHSNPAALSRSLTFNETG